VSLAGAEPGFLPLRAEDGWRPRFELVDPDQARASKVLLLGSPQDPTGAICGPDCLRDAVAFCREHELLLIHDIRWSEFGLGDEVAPGSVLQLPGARECALEISTVAASHRLSGWAPGFLAGEESRIAKMRLLAGHRGPGPFLAVQRASVAALTGDDSFLADQRRELRRRQERLREGLAQLGWEIPASEATIFLWARIPTAFGSDDLRFIEEFFAETDVLLAPGSAFGPGGEGWVRISLSMDATGLDACLSSIEESGFLARG
jgi:LL-diaminopimelate aminotransferase